MNRFAQLAWAGACALALGLGPSAAVACAPPPEGAPSFTATDRTKGAALVLEGTVLAVLDPLGDTAKIQVQQYLKGSGLETLTIRGFGPGSACLSEVQAGDHLIFYVDTASDGDLRASYTSALDAIATVSPELLAEITAAAGQSPVKPLAPPPAPR